MLQSAQSDDERLNACKTLWTLAFDDENKQEIKNNQFAIAELQNLLSSENSELRRAAAGALWECQGKDRHAEKKRHSDTAQEATGTKWLAFFLETTESLKLTHLVGNLREIGCHTKVTNDPV